MWEGAYSRVESVFSILARSYSCRSLIEGIVWTVHERILTEHCRHSDSGAESGRSQDEL